MSPTTETTAEISERVLDITRVYNAPRDLMFSVWTDKSHQANWVGPKNFTMMFCECDFRVGGSYRTGIKGPDGKEYIYGGVYRTIKRPEKLVYTFAWEDENGDPVHETVITVTFEEVAAGKTRVNFHQSLFRTVKERDDHNGGWSECFDKLAAYAESLS